jgi:hypothetical protein
VQRWSDCPTEITSEKPYDERATLIGATVSAADPGEMIRADTFARDSLIVAINFRTSCPAACDISFRTRRTALKLFIDRLLLQQFQRRDKNGHAYTQNTVHPADMPEFVGIGQMSDRSARISPLKQVIAMRGMAILLALVILGCGRGPLLPGDVPELQSLTVAQARLVAERKGNLYFRRLTALSSEAAEALAKHEGLLSLNGLTTLSDAAVAALATHQGGLFLDGLTALTDEQAEVLAKHRGELHLKGLTELSDAQATSLAKHRGGFLALDGLTSLSQTAAERLATHEGALSLNGLTTLSEKALKALRRNVDILLPDPFGRSVRR